MSKALHVFVFVLLAFGSRALHQNSVITFVTGWWGWQVAARCRARDWIHRRPGNLHLRRWRRQDLLSVVPGQRGRFPATGWLPAGGACPDSRVCPAAPGAPGALLGRDPVISPSCVCLIVDCSDCAYYTAMSRHRCSSSLHLQCNTF